VQSHLENLTNFAFSPTGRKTVDHMDVLPCISPAGWVGKHRHRKRIASVAWPWRVVEELA
jgi:hypothetical protein